MALPGANDDRPSQAASGSSIEELKKFKDLMLSSVSNEFLNYVGKLRESIDEAIEMLEILKGVSYTTLCDVIIGNRELTNKLVEVFSVEYDEFVNFEWDNIAGDNELLYSLITRHYDLVDVLNGEVDEDVIKNDLKDDFKHSDHDMKAFIRTLEKSKIVDSLEIRNEVLEARQ